MNDLIQIEEPGQLVVTANRPTPPAAQFLPEALELEIDDQLTYELADERLKFYLGVVDSWTTERDKALGPMKAATEAVRGWFDPVIRDAKAAAERVKGVKLTYQSKMEALQREAQADVERATRELRDKQAAAAQEAQAAGQVERAAALRETATTLVAPKVDVGFVQTAGTSKRREWRGRVTDKRAAVLALLESYPDLVEVDESKLNKLAKVNRANIPGVEFYEHEIAVQRRT